MFPENKLLFSQYEGEIYADERTNRELITTLEEVLVVNPKSRDVLYSLALLYDKNGDELQSAEYLRQARAVDPEVGR
jgi:Tfp pilus assembly protein PilF